MWTLKAICAASLAASALAAPSLAQVTSQLEAAGEDIGAFLDEVCGVQSQTTATTGGEAEAKVELAFEGLLKRLLDGEVVIGGRYTDLVEGVPREDLKSLILDNQSCRKHFGDRLFDALDFGAMGSHVLDPEAAFRTARWDGDFVVLTTELTSDNTQLMLSPGGVRIYVDAEAPPDERAPLARQTSYGLALMSTWENDTGAEFGDCSLRLGDARDPEKQHANFPSNILSSLGGSMVAYDGREQLWRDRVTALPDTGAEALGVGVIEYFSVAEAWNVEEDVHSQLTCRYAVLPGGVRIDATFVKEAVGRLRYPEGLVNDLVDRVLASRVPFDPELFTRIGGNASNYLDHVVVIGGGNLVLD